MADAKSVCIPLASHFWLSSQQCKEAQEDKEFMDHIPYKFVVGSLMYAMVSTRLYISHAVGVVSKFMSNPGKPHWEAVKYILWYLKGTSYFCLSFGKGKAHFKLYLHICRGSD